MKPGPAAVAEIIIGSFELGASPEALEDVVCRIIRAHPDWGRPAEEVASLWNGKIHRILSETWNKMMLEGKQPRFAFNSVSSYKIQGACFIEPRDAPEVKKQKELRSYSGDYYGHLRLLSPEEFEVLCARVLKLLGVVEPHQTPYRGDQGIDFFGKMSIGDITGHGAMFPVFESNLVFWMVGQAKHYLHSKVSTPDIRELVGSAMLGRSRAFAKEDMLQHLRIRTCDPVMMLFFTTGQLSADGWALCRNAGIVAMDGERLASFLADKAVGMKNENGIRSFDKTVFSDWLGV